MFSQVLLSFGQVGHPGCSGTGFHISVGGWGWRWGCSGAGEAAVALGRVRSEQSVESRDNELKKDAALLPPCVY